MSLSIDELRKRFNKEMNLLSKSYDNAEKYSDSIVDFDMSDMIKCSDRVNELNLKINNVLGKINDLGSVTGISSTNDISNLLDEFKGLTSERDSLLNKYGVENLDALNLKIGGMIENKKDMITQSNSFISDKDKSLRIVSKIVDILNEKKDNLSLELDFIKDDSVGLFDNYFAYGHKMKRLKANKVNIENKLKKYDEFGDLLTDEDTLKIEEFKNELSRINLNLTSEVDKNGSPTIYGRYSLLEDDMKDYSDKINGIENERTNIDNFLGEIYDSLRTILSKKDFDEFKSKFKKDVVEPKKSIDDLRSEQDITKKIKLKSNNNIVDVDNQPIVLGNDVPDLGDESPKKEDDYQNSIFYGFNVPGDKNNNYIPLEQAHSMIFDESNPEVNFNDVIAEIPNSNENSDMNLSDNHNVVLDTGAFTSDEEERINNYLSSLEQIGSERTIKAKKRRKVDASKMKKHVEKVMNFFKNFSKKKDNEIDEIGRTK